MSECLDKACNRIVAPSLAILAQKGAPKQAKLIVCKGDKKMNELLKVEVNENQEQTVSGRELHMFLGIETPYTKWFERMLQYGFENGRDYTDKNVSVLSDKREREYTQLDHIMKLDMAKELCMLARNEKGKLARQYFLEVEREWNTPEKVMARALKIAEGQISNLKIENTALTLENTMQKQMIAEFKPVKEYVDTILASTDTVATTQIAADYGMSAKTLNKILNAQHIIRNVGGQWILYKKHMNKGYTKSETIEVTRKDGTKKVVMQTKWTQKGRLKIHDILTGLGYQANMDKEQQKLFGKAGA